MISPKYSDSDSSDSNSTFSINLISHPVNNVDNIYLKEEESIAISDIIEKFQRGNNI